MAHVRQQLRERMQSVIAAGAASVAGRVYTNRVYSLSALKLPAITISFDSESSSLITIATKTSDRVVSIMVDVYVSATDSIDDDIDDICIEIEEALGNDFALNGLAKRCVLDGTDLQLAGDAEAPIGVARLRYSVQYVTSLTDVETAR